MVVDLLAMEATTDVSSSNLVISILQKSNQEPDGLLSQFVDHIGHISLHEAIPLPLVYVQSILN
jgi:hypothetical protein